MTISDQEAASMLSDPQIAVIRKIVDRLEREVGLRLAGLQEATQTVGLAEIRHAKGKLDTGNYGTCERCSLDIPARQMIDEPLRRICARCVEETSTREARA